MAAQYTPADRVDHLTDEQLEAMARMDARLVVNFLEEKTLFDAHRVRLLLEFGAIEAARRLRATPAPAGINEQKGGA